MAVTSIPIPVLRLLLFCLIAGIGLLTISAHTAGATDRQPLQPRTSVEPLSPAAVAFVLRYEASAPPDAPGPDRWLAVDKAKHVAGSALWTLSTQYILVSKADWSEDDALPASIASGAAIGLAKEIYDATRPAEDASARDLVADAVGIGLAVGVILL